MTININNKYFYSEYYEGITTIHIDYSLFLENESFSHKNELLDFLDMTDANEEVKTLVVSNDYPSFSLEKYKDQWDAIYESENYESNILRIFRTFNEVFLKLKSMQKIIISVYTKPTNAMLFSLGMSADLRFVSRDFYIDNNNYNFVNIPKGGTTFAASNLMYVNPIKMFFQSDKVFPTDLYTKHVIDDKFNPEELTERIHTIAKRFSKFDYVEFEAVKIVEHNKIKDLDSALQKENDYLLTCIRKKKNSNGGHLPRIK